ncbi:MAG: N-acetylneuraminate synthase [Spirochaetae bacterium HGW-Spirochaetae-1]|jgi:sialic acid synthase SpsE|nr:MAG: N-acetylneuraminate synthase [Spirochaetae bacterium HGW-Spirochaetae-1]
MLDTIIGKKDNRRCIFIAEIGLNHNGDMEVARAMIEAAAAAGADAVKFQTIVPQQLNSIYTTALLESGREDFTDESPWHFFEKFTLTGEEYAELQKLSRDLGLVFFSSPFDELSVELLETLDVSLYKIASSEVTNLPLIKKIAKTGKPAILSTGISQERDITDAINVFRKNSGGELILLHCVSLYPLEPAQANLMRIVRLRERFSLDVGFSDHSRDAKAMVAAAALGARIFEKHFTIDSAYDCPDKDVSVTPEQFARMIESVEECVDMLGSGAIGYGEHEKGVARAARRSLFARRFIAKGAVIKEEDLVSFRPGVGIAPNEAGLVIGRTASTDIKKDFLIRREYLV